jgi:DNA-binding LacI/PurR family transcriptional regulator
VASGPFPYLGREQFGVTRHLGANQQDLARAAGVSVSTVSRALSNSPGISAQVRAEIFELAQELGYRQRGAAKTRRQVRAYVTSNVMSGGLVSFYSAVVAGMEAAAKTAGLDLDIRLVQQRLDANRLRRDSADKAVSGTLFVGLDATPDMQELFAPDRPLVLVNGIDPTMRHDSVTPNNFYGALSATRLLLQAGHRHLLHIREQLRETTLQRQLGFFAAIAEVPGATGEVLDILHDGDVAIERAAKLKKSGKAKWTGVFGVHDNAAIRLMHALANAGVAIPGDLSIIGFDDLPAAAMTTPRLSTMRVDCVAIGAQGMELMLRRLADPAASVLQLECGVTLAIGSSITQIA